MSALLQVNDISRHFAPRLSLGEKIAASLGSQIETRALRAVDRVTLSIARGEVLGLVGESGCGKSTLGRMMAGILSPTAGEALLDGEPVMSAGSRPRKSTTRIQMVFQDPFASLDPRMKIGDAIGEGPIAHGLIAAREAAAYVGKWLDAVGLEAQFAARYPHQFSGGQRQRIAIARALAMQPEVLICDEPVASLDISIQAQIINLFLELRRELGLTMLFISHDLGVVRHLSDRVAIMYLGRIVETGRSENVYREPRHPYTRALLESVPRLVLEAGATVVFKAIQGELPSPLSPPPGCHFHQRCPDAQPRCRQEAPALEPVRDERTVACHFPIGIVRAAATN
ncbi:MAG: ATP-binding cassette domain-containing protein [Burkholderiaceae bacterium]|nr:ATP-binding cassette domain-containing protein [Burkholderiaceae bacterium]